MIGAVCRVVAYGADAPEAVIVGLTKAAAVSLLSRLADKGVTGTVERPEPTAPDGWLVLHATRRLPA